MSVYKEIGETIVNYRREKGCTQEWLALECDISVSYLRQIEHGKANPTIAELLIIVSVLGLGFRNPLFIPEAMEAAK